ncbi:hypothetical protein FC50_GL000378 [Lacticaseibacillus pantheris DSM 15945 = JCM 12539 = NBRC 106106]|uniref:Uncharacterized protein n=1 Tax=Lacticaseibacillus pantheris DSM 15945 = JCM 12539 = NBRC 106106 TaxID=1423783 RepID=A0A0R1U600_9LACO|nr:hypothetical protein FC50_GL000378 [Lacticaseibacillus pantheris DSM 15945 = JCM 12539 = NBRC 106106]
MKEKRPARFTHRIRGRWFSLWIVESMESAVGNHGCVHKPADVFGGPFLISGSWRPATMGSHQ